MKNNCFILIIIIFNFQFTYANIKNNSDTCNLKEVDLGIFRRHMIVEQKLSIAKSILEKYRTNSKMIFFFANPLKYLDDAATLIILDSGYRIVEGFKFRSCCDETVFENRKNLNRKIIRKLSRINLNEIDKSMGYFECDNPELTGMFSQLFILSNGKIESGLLIGSTGIVNSSFSSSTILVHIFNVINCR